jgi:hypothetical protein
MNFDVASKAAGDPVLREGDELCSGSASPSDGRSVSARRYPPTKICVSTL